jgi:rhodanese-related sulfurtransferase
MTTIDDRAARQDAAARWFSARLDFEADVSDVHALIEEGRDDVVLVDARSRESWDQGRVPGALHLPHREIGERAAALVDPDHTVVTYCWGPGCNGATRAALAFSLLGYSAKEMIGGFEYWAREGFAVATDAGTRRRAADPLTAPLGSVHCGC